MESDGEDCHEISWVESRERVWQTDQRGQELQHRRGDLIRKPLYFIVITSSYK